MGKEQATQVLASLLSQGVPEWIVESLITDDGIDISKIAMIQSSLDDGTFQEADFIPHDETFNPFGDKEERMRAMEESLGIDPNSMSNIEKRIKENYEDTIDRANRIQPGASDTLTPNVEEVNQYPTAAEIQIENPDTIQLPESGISGPNVINPATGVLGGITPVNPSQLTNSKKSLFGTGKGALANWKPGQNIEEGKGIFGQEGGFGSGSGALANWSPFGHMKPQTVTTPGPFGGQALATSHTVPGQGLFGKDSGFGSGAGALAKLGHPDGYTPFKQGFGSGEGKLANFFDFSRMKPKTTTGPLGGQAFASTTPGEGLFGKPGGFGSGSGKLSEIPGKLATIKETINSKLDRFANWEPGQGEGLFGKEGGFASGEGGLSQWEPFGHMKEGKGLFGKEEGFGSGKGALSKLGTPEGYSPFQQGFGSGKGKIAEWAKGIKDRETGIFGKDDGFGSGKGALANFFDFSRMKPKTTGVFGGTGKAKLMPSTTPGEGLFGREGGFGSGSGALSQWSPFQQGFGSGEGKLAQWSPFQNIKEGKGVFGKDEGFGSGSAAFAKMAQRLSEGKGLFKGKEAGFGSGKGKLNKWSKALKGIGQSLLGKKGSKVTKPFSKLFNSLTKERKYLGNESILQAVRDLTSGVGGQASVGDYGSQFYGGSPGYNIAPPTLNPIMNVGMQSHHDFKKGSK